MDLGFSGLNYWAQPSYQRTKTIKSRMIFQYLNVQYLNLFLNKVPNNHFSKVSNLNIWNLYVYILAYNGALKTHWKLGFKVS